MCSRCVRFTREISGTAEMQIINRGSHAEIDIFPGMPCNNKLAGNVVDICPVGALCSKDFLYKQRVWWLKSKPSVCPNCSTGCSINVDENDEKVYRYCGRVTTRRPRESSCATRGASGSNTSTTRIVWCYRSARSSASERPAGQRLVGHLAAVQNAALARGGQDAAPAAGGRAVAVDDVRRGVPAGQISEIALQGRAARDWGPCGSLAKTIAIRNASTANRPSRPHSRSAREKCPNRGRRRRDPQAFRGRSFRSTNLKSPNCRRTDRQPLCRWRRSRTMEYRSRSQLALETQAARGAGYSALTRKRSGPLRSSRGRLRREGRNVHQSRGARTDDRALRAMSRRSAA